jgi:hypothetical protein
MKKTQKGIFTFISVSKPQCKIFSKINFGGYIWTYKDQFANFFGGDIITKILFNAYMENTLNGDKSTWNVFNSVNNNTK